MPIKIGIAPYPLKVIPKQPAKIAYVRRCHIYMSRETLAGIFARYPPPKIQYENKHTNRRWKEHKSCVGI